MGKIAAHSELRLMKSPGKYEVIRNSVQETLEGCNCSG
jgi:hypothetical protein